MAWATTALGVRSRFSSIKINAPQALWQSDHEIEAVGGTIWSAGITYDGGYTEAMVTPAESLALGLFAHVRHHCGSLRTRCLLDELGGLVTLSEIARLHLELVDMAIGAVKHCAMGPQRPRKLG